MMDQYYPLLVLFFFVALCDASPPPPPLPGAHPVCITAMVMIIPDQQINVPLLFGVIRVPLEQADDQDSRLQEEEDDQAETSLLLLI